MVLSFLSVILVVLGVLSFLVQRNLTASLSQVAGQELHNQVRSQIWLIEAALDSQVDLLQSFSGSQTRQNWIIAHNQSYEGLTETAQIPALLAEREQLWQAASTEAEAFIASRLDNQAAADLLSLQTLFPDHLELFLTDQYGGIIAATQPSRTYNQADESWWQTAYNQGQGQLYIGQPEQDENRQTMVLPLAIPLRDAQKQVIGILHSTYRLADILAILTPQNQSLPAGTNMAILFPDDQLYDLESGQFEALSATEAALLRDSEAVGYGQMPFRGQERLLAWATFEDGAALTTLRWQFIIAQEPQIGLALVQEQRRYIILLSMGGVGLVILSAFYVAGRISRPLNRITLAAQQVVAGDLKAVAPVTTADEVGLLAQNFNTMTDRLRDLIDNLEERVAERTQQLEVVATLSGQLSAILDFEQLLTELVNQIGANFHYYHTQIYLLDEAGENLIMTNGTGPAGTQMSRQNHHIPLNAPTNLVARAARSGQVIRADNVREIEDWLPNPLLPDTYAEMAVPIVGKGQVVGVLDVQENKIGGLDEGDANLLRSLAGHVAVALTNARLFEQTRQAQQTAEVAQQAAEIANQAKSDFLSGMSHELRTPLNGILGYSQILKRSRTMAETDRKGVGIIQNSGEHLL
ncbi:MAG: GAF domain-containing protein, partial [Rhodobacteraceae bacterium]|nr:GAF domain-containing protein [Paracoccaceae bacterium]